MKKLRLFIMILTSVLFLLAPLRAFADSAPPVGQTVIREGDYAVELAQALGLGTMQDSADAENALAAYGIAPASGWISNFPVTPDIVAQIALSVDKADLPIGRDSADKALVALNQQMGLAVTPASEDTAGPTYSEPTTVVNNYYYDEGPPVITYYAPPPDYAYLYSWDPFPFWCGGFYFPGYYVLTDFDFVFMDRGDFRFHDRDEFRYMREHHHFRGDVVVTNHVTDPVTRKAVVVDPVSKRPFTHTAFRPVGARSFRPVAAAARPHGQAVIGNVGRRLERTPATTAGAFNRPSAERILNRSLARANGGRVMGARSRFPVVSSNAGSRPGIAPQTRTFAAPNRAVERPHMSTGRTFSSPPAIERSFSRPPVNRPFSSPPAVQRSFSRPPESFSRPSIAPQPRGGFGGRGFSAPQVRGGGFGGGRAFSAPQARGGGFGGRGFGGRR